MKLTNGWLGLALGVTIGLVVGLYVGGSPTDGGSGSARVRVAATGSGVSSSSDRREAATVPINEWLARYTPQFEKAVQNQPTPGMKGAFVDALLAPEPFDQGRVLLLIEMMRKEDFPVVLEILRNTKAPIHFRSAGRGGPPAWIAFWQKFGEIDPQGALAKALECGDLEYAERKFLEKNVFGGMAKANAPAAAEAFLAHPELRNRTIAVEGLIFEWSKSDAMAASDWASRNLEGDTLNAAFYAVTWGLADEYDISRADAFVKGMPEGGTRNNAVRAIKSQISNKPYLPVNQLLDFVATTRGLGSRDRKFEGQIAARCAVIDPLAAANFFSQAQPGDKPDDYAELCAVTARWVRQDLKGAETWAKGKEGMPFYQSIATEFARAAEERGDQSEAQRWLSAITPENAAGR